MDSRKQRIRNTFAIVALVLLLGCSADNEHSTLGSLGGTHHPPGGTTTGPGADAGECIPDCSGKVCGPNGCNDFCGKCAPGETCSGGQCACVPQCGGKNCGPDQCGGTCGTCGGTQICGADSTCCTLSCTNKDCGDDGCGGSCGTCPAAKECDVGQCVDCEPECDGKFCGDDGCGAACGICPQGSTCLSGQCLLPCTVFTFEGCCDGEYLRFCKDGLLHGLDCTPLPFCGWDDVLDFYDCKTAGQSDPSGLHPKLCPVNCSPNCAGKVCGPNLCGGACGICPKGEICDASGQCYKP